MAADDNLVYAWKMNATSGNETDEVASKVLTDAGAVGTTTGKLGNARQFPKTTNGYMTTANTAELAFQADASISMWFRRDAGGSDTVMGVYGAGTSARSWYLKVQTNQWTIFHWGGSTQQQSLLAGTVSTGTWYHLVLTYDFSLKTYELFIDTVSTLTFTPTNQIDSPGSEPFAIGARASGTDLINASMDMITVYDAVIPSSQISDIYNSGSGIEQPQAATSNVRRLVGVGGGLIGKGGLIG